MSLGPEVAWGLYERLRPSQAREIRAKAPLAYVPWGAIEYHSLHNPVGLDGLKAHGICVELAKRTGGIVLPAVYLGTETLKTAVDFGQTGFSDTLEHSPGTVARVAEELLAQLVETGFTVIVLLTSHVGQGHVAILEDSAAAISGKYPGARIWVLPDHRMTEPRWGPNHAARGETSYQMYFDESLVALDMVPSGREPTLLEDGVWGENPALATSAEGKLMLEALLEACVPQVLDLLAGRAVD